MRLSRNEPMTALPKPKQCQKCGEKVSRLFVAWTGVCKKCGSDHSNCGACDGFGFVKLTIPVKRCPACGEIFVARKPK